MRRPLSRPTRWAIAAVFTAVHMTVTGCGLFASETGSRLVGAGIDVVTRLVEREVGKHFDDLPTACESENDPETGKLLLLCTVCYRLEPGERCR